MEKKKNVTSKIKAEIVLSLLRGEDIELISRKYGVTLSDINHWRDQFIESGIEGFKRKPDDSKLSAAESKIGQLQMELELTKKERINSKAKKEMISMLIYDSADFMNEMKFLGIEMSKVFVRSPQCNGIIERFHRTLEEQVLQVEAFTSFEKTVQSNCFGII